MRESKQIRLSGSEGVKEIGYQERVKQDVDRESGSQRDRVSEKSQIECYQGVRMLTGSQGVKEIGYQKRVK